MRAILAGWLVWALALPCLGQLAIPLTAHNRSDVPRENEGISAGVPFPLGALYDDGLKTLAVFDPEGRQVPAQFTVTGRWWRERDRTQNPTNPPSIQWVLVDMMPTVPAQGKTFYVLKTRATPWESDGALKVTKTPEKVTVVTGPLKFTVKKNGFNLFDEVWVDETGKGDFSDANRIVAPHEGGFVVFSSFGGTGANAGNFSTPAWLGKNKFYSSQRCADGTLTVEEEGPLKVTVRVSGKHVATDNLPGPGHLLDYEVWITARRGSPLVNVEYVFLCRQGKNMEDGFPIDGIFAELPLAPGGKMRYTLGKPGGEAAGELGGGDNAFVEANASDRCVFGGAAKGAGEGKTKSGLPMKLRWFYDQLGGAPLPDKEYPQFPAPDNLGWVDLSNESRGVTAGIAKFWQTWPKGVEATGDGKLRLHIWSNVERRVLPMPASHRESTGDERTMSDVPGYDQRWETLHSETVPGRGNMFPGMAKSTQMGFRFHGKSDTATMRLAWAAISRPVRVVCEPAWYCERTRAYGFLASSDPGAYDPEIHKDIQVMDKNMGETLEFIRTFRAKYYDPKNERMDQYGCFNFGDNVNFVANRADPRRVETLWDNNYYDSSHCMFLQFLRTADIDILEQAIETDTHLADVDMTCWHVDPEMVGASRYSPSADHIRHDWGVRTVWTPQVYSWHRCNFDRWNLLGNRWAFEQNYRAADFVVRNSRRVNGFNMNLGHGERSIGHAIKNGVMGYLATGEKKFLQGARRMWLPNKGCGATQTGYQAGICIEGVWWYWQATGDPAALAQVLDKAPRTQWLGTKFFSYGVAFRLRNDSDYMKIAYDKMPGLGIAKRSWGGMGDWAMGCRNGLFFPWFVSHLPVEKEILQVPVGD